jgi:hypothetical protein
MSDTLEHQLQSSLAPVRSRLLRHPLYANLHDEINIRLFMASHVFAVWDFQSLLKALQQQLTCVTVPWLPTGDPEARRLINEIVLDEESDEAPAGNYLSHFELYLQAMDECGADAAPIRAFIAQMQTGVAFDDAIGACDAPNGAPHFVRTTMNIASSRQIHRVAAAFAYGREEIIPEMFLQLVKPLADLAPSSWGTLVYYLDRHIHTDGDRHAPKARALVRTFCQDDPELWREATESARISLEARETFWNDILLGIAPPD